MRPLFLVTLLVWGWCRVECFLTGAFLNLLLDRTSLVLLRNLTPCSPKAAEGEGPDLPSKVTEQQGATGRL